MPADFEKCVKDGGNVRTITGPDKKRGLGKDEYMRVCYDKDGTEHRGEKKKKKASSRGERALSALMASPWYITEEMLTMMVGIVTGEVNIDPEEVKNYYAISFPEGATTERRGLTVYNDTAVIDVIGPIFRYATLFTEISGATSVESIASNIDYVMAKDSIKRVVLRVDSPGGQVNGTSELAKKLKTLAAKKELIGYTGGSASSAAYWLISAANKIVVDDTASLGSIGVVLQLSKDNDKIVFTSSQSPYKRIDYESKEGKGKLQAHLDEVADVFIDAVAENRGVSREKVINDFGQGFVKIGKSAIEAGMADEIGTLESLLITTKEETMNLTAKTVREEHPDVYSEITSEYEEKVKALEDQVKTLEDKLNDVESITEGEVEGELAEVPDHFKAKYQEQLDRIEALERANFEKDLGYKNVDSSQKELVMKLFTINGPEIAGQVADNIAKLNDEINKLGKLEGSGKKTTTGNEDKELEKARKLAKEKGISVSDALIQLKADNYDGEEFVDTDEE